MIYRVQVYRFLLMLLLTTALHAKDLGTMGDVYPIREVDLLSFIQSRVAELKKNGQWHAIENDMQQRAMRYRDRPSSVTGFTKATETKSWLFDPSITLARAVVSPDGKRLVPAGTHVNPLTRVSLSKSLIFFDGDDETQVKWVVTQTKAQQGRTKLILVNGSLLQQEQTFHQPLFFDQAGRLMKRFSIQRVPAMVSQQGLQLRITEVRV